MEHRESMDHEGGVAFNTTYAYFEPDGHDEGDRYLETNCGGLTPKLLKRPPVCTSLFLTFYTHRGWQKNLFCINDDFGH
jgi:hypothetical protein